MNAKKSSIILRIGSGTSPRCGESSDTVSLSRFLSQFLDTYKNFRPDIWYYNGGEKPVREVGDMD